MANHLVLLNLQNRGQGKRNKTGKLRVVTVRALIITVQKEKSRHDHEMRRMLSGYEIRAKAGTRVSDTNSEQEGYGLESTQVRHACEARNHSTVNVCGDRRNGT